VAVTVREASVEDLAAVRRVARGAWHAAYDELLGRETVEATVDDWYARDALVDGVRCDGRPFLLATDDGEPVGFAEAVPVGEGAGDGGTGRAAGDGYRLARLYVDPDRWREGIGGSLLAAVEAVLRANGVARLQLSVFASNEAAVRFYETRGYEPVGGGVDDRFAVERHDYAKTL